jgi:hypothetical protein
MTIRIGTLVAALALLTVPPALAQSTPPGEWLVTPFAQGSIQLSNPSLGRPAGIGLAVARTVVPRFAVGRRTQLRAGCRS